MLIATTMSHLSIRIKSGIWIRIMMVIQLLVQLLNVPGLYLTKPHLNLSRFLWIVMTTMPRLTRTQNGTLILIMMGITAVLSLVALHPEQDTQQRARERIVMTMMPPLTLKQLGIWIRIMMVIIPVYKL